MGEIAVNTKDVFVSRNGISLIFLEFLRFVL
jgi:hypothetical protein